MDVELVFSGLCTFVNLDNDDETIIGPSVLLLNADDMAHGEHGAEEHEHEAAQPAGGDTGAPANPAPDFDTHIPFIAFDTHLVTVDNEDGFEVVAQVPKFKFLPIEGREITILNHQERVPIVDGSFANVISRDMYWPESKGHWNHDCVPRVNERPKKSAVKAFFRFGDGKIFGGRLCPFKWRFTKLNGDTFSRHFAEEATYTYRDTDRNEMTIRLFELENPSHKDGDVLRSLKFRPVDGQSRITLFIGNNIKTDIDTAVRRHRPLDITIGPNHHFKAFNTVIDVGDERAPEPPQPEAPKNIDFKGGGGQDGGICGPTG